MSPRPNREHVRSQLRVDVAAPEPWDGFIDHLAATAATPTTPARRSRMLFSTLAIKAAASVAGATLVTSGAAYAGVLPDPVQTFAADTAATVGVDLPAGETDATVEAGTEVEAPADEPTTDVPTDEPVVEEPVVEEPVVEEPVVEEPVTDEPVVDEPVTDEPVVEEPVVEEPVIDEPVVEEPVTDPSQRVELHVAIRESQKLHHEANQAAKDARDALKDTLKAGDLTREEARELRTETREQIRDIKKNAHQTGKQLREDARNTGKKADDTVEDATDTTDDDDVDADIEVEVDLSTGDTDTRGNGNGHGKGRNK